MRYDIRGRVSNSFPDTGHRGVKLLVRRSEETSAVHPVHTMNRTLGNAERKGGIAPV